MHPKVCSWDELLRIRNPGEASSSPIQGLPLVEGGEAMKEEMLYPRVQQTPGGREEGGQGGYSFWGSRALHARYKARELPERPPTAREGLEVMGGSPELVTSTHRALLCRRNGLGAIL